MSSSRAIKLSQTIYLLNLLLSVNCLYYTLRNNLYLTEISMDIFDECLGDKLNQIVIIGNWNILKFNINHQKNIKILSLVALNKSEKVDSYNETLKYYNIDKIAASVKLSASEKFLIAELNLTSFKVALVKLRYSPWWNVYGFFLVQNIRNPNSCDQVYDYFKILWKFNILSAAFLCFDVNSQLQWYVFNPFSNKVPKSWTYVNSYEQKNGYPLTIFKYPHNLNDSKGLCSALTQDKTKVTTGYPIKICANNVFYRPNMEGPIKIKGICGEIAGTIWSVLQVSVTSHLVSDDFMVDNHGIPMGTSLRQVLNGTYDMHSVYDYSRGFWRNELNTYQMSGMCFTTNKKKMKLSEYLTEVFGLHTVIGAVCVGLVIAGFVAFISKRNFFDIVIEGLRALYGSAVLHQPKHLLPRIIFLIIIFFFMILNSYVTGQLNALITAIPDHIVKIERTEDVKELGYQVYSSNYTRQYLRGTVLYNNVTISPTVPDCHDLLRKHPEMTCAADCAFIDSITNGSQEFHLSAAKDLQQFFVFLFPIDYPLFPRIRRVYRNLYEAGIITFFKDKEKAESNRKQKHENKVKNLSIGEFKAVFYFLMFGLGIAAVVYCFEMFYYLYCSLK